MGGIKSGVAGCVLILPATFITFILAILALANPALITAAPPWYSITLIVGRILLVIGVWLVAGGTRALGRYYKNTLSTATGIVGLVAAIIGIIGAILGLVGTSLVMAGLRIVALLDAAAIINIIAFIMIGVFLLLLGVAFIILRDKIGQSGLSLGTGIMSIIAGAMTCSIILSFIGIAVLIPTAICAAYLFLKAKGIPEAEVREVKKLVVRPAKAIAKKRISPRR